MTHQPHITDYRIETASSPQALASAVQVAIHNGWQPYGAMSIDHVADPGTERYVQPMVRVADWSR